MVMVPYDDMAFKDALARRSSRSGAIPLARIDEAVRRILTVKFEMGLFENPYADPDANSRRSAALTTAPSRATAVQESLVLLSNDGTLPIAPAVTTIAVVGQRRERHGDSGWRMDDVVAGRRWRRHPRHDVRQGIARPGRGWRHGHDATPGNGAG